MLAGTACAGSKTKVPAMLQIAKPLLCKKMGTLGTKAIFD